jgi:hypothetical protein
MRTDNFAVERLLPAGGQGDGALGEELHTLCRGLPALLPRVPGELHLLPDLDDKTNNYTSYIMHSDPGPRKFNTLGINKNRIPAYEHSYTENKFKGTIKNANEMGFWIHNL